MSDREQATLTAQDGEWAELFGISVAVSGDAVVVGAARGDVAATSDAGSAYVFVKPAGGWSSGMLFEQAMLTASDRASRGRLRPLGLDLR